MGQAALLPEEEEEDPRKERQEPKPPSDLTLWPGATAVTAPSAAPVLQLGSHVATHNTRLSTGLLSEFEALLFVLQSEKDVRAGRAPGDGAQLHRPAGSRRAAVHYPPLAPNRKKNQHPPEKKRSLRGNWCKGTSFSLLNRNERK